VDDATPLIYSNVGGAKGLSITQRLVALGIALGCLGMLAIAARLEPSPEGYGTHTQIGLQQCAFFSRTGLPCPSCGMTTSWSWFVRGNLIGSLYVQPMGTILALLAVWCVWVGFYVAFTGKPVYRLLRVVPGRYYCVPLVALGIMAWGWKIYIHLAGRDGWH
jgi:hypothetical protein